MKVKCERWHDPIYHISYILLVGPHASLTGWFKSALGSECDPGDPRGVWALTMSHYSERNGHVQVFWFPPSPAPSTATLPSIVSTIAHEALHAVTSVMESKGLPLSREGDEAYTYYLGWIVEEMTSRLLKVPSWKKAMTPAKGKR